MLTDLSRPFGRLSCCKFRYSRLIFIYLVFIVTEPIVLLLSLYISIMYGTLYALFSAFPIVFQQHRGFSPGQSGLAFIGVGVGIIMGTMTQSIQNKIYRRSMDQSETGRAPPEAYALTVVSNFFEFTRAVAFQPLTYGHRGGYFCPCGSLVVRMASAFILPNELGPHFQLAGHHNRTFIG